MTAGHHNKRQLKHTEISFGLKKKNNLIDLIENSNRRAVVGEVLIIRKLKIMQKPWSL